MKMEELLEIARNEFDIDLISKYDGFIAVQVTLTEEPFGVFYTEIKDSELHIEPYDYYDRNAEIKISPNNLINILKGKLDPVIKFTKKSRARRAKK